MVGLHAYVSSKIERWPNSVRVFSTVEIDSKTFSMHEHSFFYIYKYFRSDFQWRLQNFISYWRVQFQPEQTYTPENSYKVLTLNFLNFLKKISRENLSLAIHFFPAWGSWDVSQGALLSLWPIWGQHSWIF